MFSGGIEAVTYFRNLDTFAEATGSYQGVFWGKAVRFKLPNVKNVRFIKILMTMTLLEGIFR